MSNVTPSSIPAGWYPDPAGTPRTRWWDGAAWTDHYQEATPAAPVAPAAAHPGYGAQPAQGAYGAQAAYAAQPYSTATGGGANLSAPAGINVYNPFIWLIAALPILPMLGLLTVDWGSLYSGYDPYNPSTVGLLSIYASPGYILTTLLGWVIYGLCVFFAYRDFSYLKSVGVPRPFHWAWAFLSSIVYVIGRSVVVGRRTGGQGKTPMWIAIGMIALSFIIVVVITIQMVNGIMSTVSNF